jgi:hypothetical protein
MCLSTVTSHKKYTGTKNFHPRSYKIGWKIVRDCTYYCRGLWFGFECKYNQWTHDFDDDVIGHYKSEYSTGFHIFTNQQDAINLNKEYNNDNYNFCVVKVRYRYVVARGKEQNHDCVVAKDIFIERPN